MVALKKVRFDTLQPESIRFMAREIIILRTLDHPNIMKLEGIITSQLSNTIYLVFEYMEHDLAGLVSNPDIKFTDSQVCRHFLCDNFGAFLSYRLVLYINRYHINCCFIFSSTDKMLHETVIEWT